MAKKSSNGKTAQKVGFWLFLLGIVIALLAAFVNLNGVLVTVLILLGLLVGFLNVTADETTPFLLAVVALVVVNTFGGNILQGVEVVGPNLQAFLNAVVVFVVPATLVVALRAIYSLAKN